MYYLFPYFIFHLYIYIFKMSVGGRRFIVEEDAILKLFR